VDARRHVALKPFPRSLLRVIILLQLLDNQSQELRRHVVDGLDLAQVHLDLVALGRDGTPRQVI
jgi:hypothetical protein